MDKNLLGIRSELMGINSAMLLRCKLKPGGSGPIKGRLSSFWLDLTKSDWQKESLEATFWELLVASLPLETSLDSISDGIRLSQSLKLAGNVELSLSWVTLWELWLLEVVIHLPANAASNWRCLRIPRWCEVDSYIWLEKLPNAKWITKLNRQHFHCSKAIREKW